MTLVSEDTVPEATVGLLREACRQRNIPFEVLTARTFDFDPSQRLQTGDMLYRAAVSIAALRAEQFLFADYSAPEVPVLGFLLAPS